MGISEAIAASAIAGVAGSAISASGASGAAKTASAASDRAQLMAQQQYIADSNRQAPFVNAAYNNLPAYQDYWKNTSSALDSAYNKMDAAVPGAMTQANLEQTPGYQWNLSQGLKATQNAAAAKGLGVSGAAMNSGANFATGLANSTYKDQFNMAQQQYADRATNYSNLISGKNAVFGQLASPISIGQNAATNVGNNGAALNGQATQALTSGANTAAQAQAASANSLANGASTAGNAGLNYLALTNQLNNSGNAYNQGGAVKTPVDSGSSGWTIGD